MTVDKTVFAGPSSSVGLVHKEDDLNRRVQSLEVEREERHHLDEARKIPDERSHYLLKNIIELTMVDGWNTLVIDRQPFDR